MAAGIILKILVVGDEGVGKTCLIKRFTENIFPANSRRTIGVDFSVKKITVGDVSVKLQIWDFGGHSYYRQIQYTLCDGAKGVILAFDLSNFETFKKLGEWVRFLKNAVAEETPKILVGTKSDLKWCRPAVRDVKNFIEKNNFQNYFETSAKENITVQPPFHYLAKIIIKNKVKTLQSGF
ncbi:MAG: GTP-binding protein [Candidatus Odinarchaeum yellowstonii]|uniref:GTP-binding protein n=1 Tax=Odinarchaeota yellowstonii (strain LCB_4) TaxID=1841599 RepID=A0AAF0D3A8_ODILC|nr:MAG: GTP-binding protein [Candidatus Odinarchaeum yellowstonii]